MPKTHLDAINALEYLSGEFKEHSSEYKLADHIIKDYYQNYEKDGRMKVKTFMEDTQPLIGSKKYWTGFFEAMNPEGK